MRAPTRERMISIMALVLIISICFLVPKAAARPHYHFLFLSSQIFGSQSSTLFPSGSMIQRNAPFS